MLVTPKRERGKWKNEYRRKNIIQGTARNLIYTDAMICSVCSTA